MKRKVYEDLTHSEIDDVLTSREFKKKVKEITADVFEQFFKEMWTRKGMWKNSIK